MGKEKFFTVYQYRGKHQLFLIGKQPNGYMFLLILLSSFGQGLIYDALSGLNYAALSERMFD
jgi:hypothetical protein